MRIRTLVLAAGALALLAGTVQAGGWGGNMPWNGKGDAPWSGHNMPWSNDRRGWNWGGSKRGPWKRGGWKRGGGDKWDDWMPWGSGSSPWKGKGWGDMPWSNDHKRRWRRPPPYGYYGQGRGPGYPMPRGRGMMPQGGYPGAMMPPGGGRMMAPG